MISRVFLIFISLFLLLYKINVNLIYLIISMLLSIFYISYFFFKIFSRFQKNNAKIIIKKEEINNKDALKASFLYSLFPYPHKPLFIKPIIPKISLVEKCMHLSQNTFLPSHKILLAGCGTDEPLFFRMMCPQNHITGIDLSLKSIKIASLKIRLWSSPLSSKTFFIQGNLVEILQNSSEKYDFIQCFGVLMIQKNPEELFSLLSSHLEKRGLLRLMIYSSTGRKLERILQRRYLKENKSLYKEVWKKTFLIFWIKIFGKSKWKKRFSYLSWHPSAIADTFFHPTDVELKPEILYSWIKKEKLKITYSFAKAYDDILESTSENAEENFFKIIEENKKNNLMSNIQILLQKES